MRQLIAVAMDPATNTNEARNAAMQACVLLTRHGFTLNNEQKARGGGSFEDVLRGMSSDMAFDTLLESLRNRPRPAPPQPSVHASEKKVEEDLRAKEIPVGGMETWFCSGCGLKLPAGTMVMWCRGLVWHKLCWAARRGR